MKLNNTNLLLRLHNKQCRLQDSGDIKLQDRRYMSAMALALEEKYVKSLKNSKDVLDYIKQREDELFLEAI